MKNKVFISVLCLSILSLLFLGFVSGKRSTEDVKSEPWIRGDFNEDFYPETEGMNPGRSESGEEKLILLEAKEDYKKLGLKEKKKLREKKRRISRKKRQEDLKKEKNLQDKRNKKRKLRMGESLFDEDKFLKEHGIDVKRPKVKVKDGALPSKKTVVDFSKGADISQGKEKVVLKKKNKKGKKHKLNYEDLVMTDEEEAAYWGYSMEEWENLSDKEKYGSCDESKANTEFGGKTMNWDFE